jgi:hypothetical protein
MKTTAVTKKSKLKPVYKTTLPKWLYGMQALTWLVTNDEKLTKQATPKRGMRATDTDVLDETPPAKIKSSAEQSVSAGNPDDWGGVTLMWLSIKAENHKIVDHAISHLVSAAASGKIKTLDSKVGRPEIPQQHWVDVTLDEDSKDYRSLVMLQRTTKTGSTAVKICPLFERDKVFALSKEIKIQVGESQSYKKLADWMLQYAKEYIQKNGRRPKRDKEGVPDAQQAGFYGIAKIRRAYKELPEELKVPPRKPKKQK